MMNNLLPALREGLVSDEDLNEFTKMENPEENYPYLRGKLANIIQNHITTVKEAKSFAPLIDKVIKAAPDDYHRKEAIHKIIEPLIEAGIHVDSALPENIRSEAKPVVKKLINEDLNGFKGGTEENQQRAERRAILLAPNMDLEEHNKWGAIYPNMKMNSPHSTDDEIASSHVSSPSHYPVLNPSVKHQETLAYLGRSNDTNPNSDAHRDNRSPDQLSQILHGGDGATVSGDHKQYITADEQGRAILPGGKFVAAKKEPLPVHVQEGYSDIPKKMDYKPSEYGEISTQNSSELKGKKTWAKTLLKSFKKRKNP
jgi:hypothetical protein